MRKDLKVLYKEKIVPSMIKDFGYKNVEQVPKVIKIQPPLIDYNVLKTS